jgi:hypothetical protein
VAAAGSDAGADGDRGATQMVGSGLKPRITGLRNAEEDILEGRRRTARVRRSDGCATGESTSHTIGCSCNNYLGWFAAGVNKSHPVLGWPMFRSLFRKVGGL